MLDNTEKFWEESWLKHIETYLTATPRAGVFLQKYFNNKSKKILEIAGGSCSDSRYLANNRFLVTGSDFDEKTLNYLQKERFKDDILKYSKEDAFNLSFEDNSFDMVFHNGFFVLFDDNKSLNNMLFEQERVSKKYIVFFVHNKKNINQVEQFREKAKDDDLYKIRFFDNNEVVDIIKNSGIKYKKINILKFGGLFDVFYKKKLKKIIPNILYPFRNFLIPKLYQFQKWENTERVCCIIELDK